MTRDDIARLSRVFNAGSDLRTEQDRRINEWLKGLLAAASERRGCIDHTPPYAGCADCADTLFADVRGADDRDRSVDVKA